MTALLTNIEREYWLAQRTEYLGATDIAAILGMHPYTTPLHVYEQKRGLAQPQAETPAMRRGTRMEPYVAGLYTDETGFRLDKAATVMHRRKPWLGVNPDYIASDEDADDEREWLVELKTHNPFTADGYGEPGTDQVPAHEVIQCTWQMHVTGMKPSCDLAVLFGLDDFRIYTVDYDPELGATLEEQADRFWQDYVLGDCPPPLSGHPADEEWLKRRFPQDAGITVRATPEVEAHCIELAAARKSLRIVEAEKTRLELAIKQYMGQAAVLEWSGGKPFTWKTTKPSEATDWKAVAAALNAPADLIAANTTTKPGSRRFLTPFRED